MLFLHEYEYFLDTQVATEVMILSYLIPPKGRTKIKGGKHWKFSTIESSESMILHCKVIHLLLHIIMYIILY